MDDESYTARAIRVLSDADAIRQHPAMFVGGTGSRGLHHLARELIDNAVDEALAGFCRHITVHVRADGSLAVTDDGRGIPVEPVDSGAGPAAEVVMTTLHAGAKFGAGAYDVSGGVHGVGLSCVCALSDRLELDVWRHGHHYREVFARGEPLGALSDLGALSPGPAGARTGTAVRFWPDPAVFEDPRWSEITLASRLEQLAFLVPGLELELVDDRDGTTRRWHTQAGLGGMVREMAGAAQPAQAAPLLLAGEHEGIRVDVALWWTHAPGGTVRSFANAVPTERGGTHEQGFQHGLVETLRAAGADGCTADDAGEGLCAVVSVWCREPQFEGQTKSRLSTREAEKAVHTVVVDALGGALRADPALCEALVAKVSLATRARVAAAAARRSAHQHKRDVGSLAGRLADCARDDPAHSELFLVEGPSAGGSAKQARDRQFQAVLPLRGKILNAERATLDQVLHNAELDAIVEALGCGVGEACDPARCRYGRVVIMADADPDGAHIRALLLTFFFRELRPLVAAGRVYIARPPLYRVRVGQTDHYLVDDAALVAFTRNHPGATVQRFKGLGEMSPAQLRATTMAAATRTLVRVRLDDVPGADHVFHLLMGEDVAARRRWIERAWEELPR